MKLEYMRLSVVLVVCIACFIINKIDEYDYIIPERTIF